MQHIYFCADNKYIPFTAVTMASILLNAKKDEEIFFHIIGNDILDVEKNKVNQLKNIKSCEIDFISVDDSIFTDLMSKMNMGYLSVAAFYRFLIPSLASKNIDKVLYLDGDMVITGPLNELFDVDLDGYMAGVVEEKGAFQVGNLSLKGKKYFNSGMMLLNLKEINADDFLSDAFTYYEKNCTQITCHDQDILNGLMDEKAKFLTQKYNVPSFVKCEKDPLIIHYTGFMKKPWLCFSRHPLKKQWHKYAQLTAYKKCPLELLCFNLKSFLSKIFLLVKDPTHKKYYVMHLLGLKFGLGTKDDKSR